MLADHGVSGISTRLADRPEGKRLNDKLRKGDVLVVRWVDQLGRKYQDVTATVRDHDWRHTPRIDDNLDRGRREIVGPSVSFIAWCSVVF